MIDGSISPIEYPLVSVGILLKSFHCPSALSPPPSQPIISVGRSCHRHHHNHRYHNHNHHYDTSVGPGGSLAGRHRRISAMACAGTDVLMAVAVRRRKTASERRQQGLRAEGRLLQRCLSALRAIHGHRGNQLSRLGCAFAAVLEPQLFPQGVPTPPPPAVVVKRVVPPPPPPPAREARPTQPGHSGEVGSAVVALDGRGVGAYEVPAVATRCLGLDAAAPRLGSRPEQSVVPRILLQLSQCLPASCAALASAVGGQGGGLRADAVNFVPLAGAGPLLGFLPAGSPVDHGQLVTAVSTELTQCTVVADQSRNAMKPFGRCTQMVSITQRAELSGNVPEAPAVGVQPSAPTRPSSGHRSAGGGATTGTAVCAQTDNEGTTARTHEPLRRSPLLGAAMAVTVPAMTRNAVMQFLTMQFCGITGQFQPMVQIIKMAERVHEGSKRLVLIISDGDASMCAIIALAAEHQLQGVPNHSLLQLFAWRLIERHGHLLVVVSDLKYVALHSGLIGQPKHVLSLQAAFAKQEDARTAEV